MNIKYRLGLDAIMFLVIWPVMGYSITGNLIHEILGLVLIAVFLFHILLNRQYYSVMIRKIFSDNKVNLKNALAFVVNVLLLVAVAVMPVSSLVISRDLFAFANYGIASTMVWRTIHIICAVTIMICAFVHVLLHVSMFRTLMKRKIQAPGLQKLTGVGSGILAVALAVVAVKMSYSGLSSIAMDYDAPDYDRRSHREDGQSVVRESDTDLQEEHLQEEYLPAETQSDTKIPTLEEYLKGLFCNGCGRHCSLLSPQCRKGVSKADTAQTEYYNTYGEQ